MPYLILGVPFFGKCTTTLSRTILSLINIANEPFSLIIFEITILKFIPKIYVYLLIMFSIDASNWQGQRQ